jgi:hypothetical protein
MRSEGIISAKARGVEGGPKRHDSGPLLGPRSSLEPSAHRLLHTRGSRKVRAHHGLAIDRGPFSGVRIFLSGGCRHLCGRDREPDPAAHLRTSTVAVIPRQAREFRTGRNGCFADAEPCGCAASIRPAPSARPPGGGARPSPACGRSKPCSQSRGGTKSCRHPKRLRPESRGGSRTEPVRA